MTIPSTVRRAAAGAALGVVLASCGGSGPPSAGTEVEPVPSEPPPTAATATAWLAAIAVAPSADDLDAKTASLKEPLGPALVVSPVDCFEGLPAGVDDGYLIGAVGEAREQVLHIATEAQVDPIFVRSVTILCTD